MKRMFGLALLGSVSILAINPAYGQAAPESAPDSGKGQSSAAAPVNVPDIIVTGSRVITNGNNSPTPVTVIPTQQLLTVQPTTVIDAVNLAPALQGSQSLSSPPGGGQRNGAAAYFNLRALGDLRTLVLMDGHRVVPTINAFGGNTDSFVVPQLLIQRVDVVTGGVSAVYGSDAVSGVVNFVTDRAFNGIKVQGALGISNYGDGAQRDIGAAVGTSFAGGRGHVEFSYQYRFDAGIDNQLARPWFARSLGGGGLGTAASPYYNIENSRISSTSFGGLITNPTGPLAGMQFATNGVLTAFNPGTPTGTTGVASGGDGGWYQMASIKSGLEFHQGFGRLDYDLTDDIHAYVQGSGSYNHTNSAFRSPLETVTLSYSNAYAQAVPQLAAQAALTPNGTFTFSKLFNIPPTANQYTKNYMIHGGVDGTLGDFKWELNFGKSMSQIKAVTNVNVDQAKFFAAIDAVKAPGTDRIICRAALTNPNYAGCVPLNLFGPTAASAEALDYVINPTFNRNRTTLSEIGGSVTGAPFDTWAGPVTMALSGEYRDLSWTVTGNATPSDPVDCVGIVNNCTATSTRWLQTTQPPVPTVHQKVSEAAYEIDIPLLKDSPLAASLNVNGAVRYTHYSTSGDVVTWKAGLVWRPVDELTIRGTASRDIRAPNVFELFGPRTVAPVTITDPLTNTTNRVNVFTIANPNLTPEKAQSFTGGFVWTPGFARGLSLTVDAYYIKVNNAITQLNGNSPLVQNLCASTLGTNPACVVVIRPLPYSNTTKDNFPTQLLNQYLNIASYKTYGVDFEANYRTDLFAQPFSLRALASYQPKLEFNQGPAGVIQLAGAATGLNPFFGVPKFKYTLIASYDVDDNINLTILQRGRGRMKVSAVVTGQPEKVFLNGRDHDPAATFTNLTMTFKFDKPGKNELYFNVQNLFNKQPNLNFPGANAQPGLGQVGFFPPNGDDVIGRYFTVGFRSRF